MTKITQIKQYIIYQKLTDKSPATLVSYRSDLMQFAIWFEKVNNTEMDLLHITPTDARQYKQYLIDSNFRPKTINRRLLSLKYFLEWGWDSKKIKYRFPLRVLTTFLRKCNIRENSISHKACRALDLRFNQKTFP